MIALLFIACGLAVLATVADIETTVQGMKLPTVRNANGTETFVIESSSVVYGTHPSRLKLYAVGALFAGAVTGLSILLAVAHWGYLSGVPPIPLAVIRGWAAIKNYRLNRKLRKASLLYEHG